MKAIFLLLLAFSACSHAATVSYDCTFPKVASPDGVKKTTEPFTMKFISDVSNGKAYIIGNNGSADVSGIPNTRGFSFLEITDSGNVHVTAITESGNAVHSRNTILSSGLVPTQYYGTCKRQ